MTFTARVAFRPDEAEPSARALHARLLANAAARRRRAVERRRAQREEDARYWLTAAPLAVAKASELRIMGALPALP